MGSLLQLSMELLSQTKRGFTLIEMVLVLFILSLLLILTPIRKPTLTLNQFENEYILTQLQAMSSFSPRQYDHQEDSNVSILTFNEWGNVNQAQTIKTSKSSYRIQLGTGRYEK